MKGTIQTITTKGFGFIRVGGGSKDYFFHKSEYHGHWNDLTKDVAEGNVVEVEFRPEIEKNGKLRAVEVKRLDFPNRAGG